MKLFHSGVSLHCEEIIEALKSRNEVAANAEMYLIIDVQASVNDLVEQKD